MEPSTDCVRSWLRSLTSQQRAALRAAIATGTVPLENREAEWLDRWELYARDEQLEPAGDWRVWYLRGGRGSGKTRTGAETLAGWIAGHEPGDWAIIAPTYGDARDVCVEGPSGLIRALGGRVENWNRSIGELFTVDGHRVFIDGADDGALRIQGKNLRGCWCDEVGLWRNPTRAWGESLSFAVRLEPGRIVATGTPKMGNVLVRELLADPTVVVTNMRTLDNAANLHPDAVRYLIDKWGGSRLGRQELEGEFLEDVPGALWSMELIDRCQVDGVPELDRIVVGVDPSGSRDEDIGTSETGIVVAGFSRQYQHGFVLADWSLHGSPEQWGRRVCHAFEQFQADMVVAERNFGGEMVSTVIKMANRNVPVRLVNAARGKAVRAEPVAVLYDQGRVFHADRFPKLEDQMTGWVPGAGMDSPDRLDALVWALTELMVEAPARMRVVERAGFREPVVRRGDLVLVGEQYVDRER